MPRKGQQQRLTRRRQFEAVLVHDCTLAGRNFLVHAMPNGMKQARLGIIAGGKAIPRAVDRNRCKRLVREVFHASQRSLAALDVVVLCRAAVPRGQIAAARQDLASLFAAASKCRGQRSVASQGI